MLKVGDNVIVITGSDKGKTGKILKTFKNEDKVIVEGVHIVKKHQKPNGQESGGILEIEAPIHVSNVMIVDPKEKKRTRIGHDIDKKTNKIVKEQSEFKYTMYENPLIDVTEYKGDTHIRTAYDSKTLKPTHYDKMIYGRTKEKHISYDFEHKEFLKYEYDNINDIEQRACYDRQGNLIGEPEIQKNTETYTHLGKPTLHPKFELNYDPKNLNGEKKYYSNGAIEENIVDENGKKVVYRFGTNGELESIEKGNLTIRYFNDRHNGTSGYSISEDFGNNKSKTSIYLNNGSTSCLIDDNGNGEQFDFNINGDIIRHLNYTYDKIE